MVLLRLIAWIRVPSILCTGGSFGGYALRRSALLDCTNAVAVNKPHLWVMLIIVVVVVVVAVVVAKDWLHTAQTNKRSLSPTLAYCKFQEMRLQHQPGSPWLEPIPPVGKKI